MHRLSAFVSECVSRLWNAFFLSLILQCRKDKAPETRDLCVAAKIGGASTKPESELSLCTRLARSLTYWYKGHTQKAAGGDTIVYGGKEEKETINACAHVHKHLFITITVR